MINIPYKQQEERTSTIHPALQFIVFFALSIGIIIVCTVIAAAIAGAIYGMKTVMGIMQLNMTLPHATDALWVLQIVGTTLPILIAAVFFAYIIVGQPREYLKTNFHFSWILLALVFFIMLISNPLIEALTNINAKMQLPHFLAGVQQWMEEKEKEAQDATTALLQMKTIGAMLWDLSMVGLLTAIVEEFMFRGVIQTIFVRWTKNTHAAIWITAILFSAFHVEFFGFLPRVMLGVLFGYFVAWSGSIWPAVWAHFINNGSAVVATYLFQHKIIKTSPDDQHLFNTFGYLVSLAIVLFLLFVYRKTAPDKKQIPDIDGEKLG